MIQARFTSKRLPGKVLRALPYGSDQTVLTQIVRRLRHAERVNDIVVVTSTNREDDPILKAAQKAGVGCYRGSLTHVLERFYLAAKESHADHIVRITGDCPCIDPQLVDQTIDHHLQSKADFTSNCFVRTFPRGLDTEVMTREVLTKIYQEAATDAEREHVTLRVYQSNPKTFQIAEVEAPKELRAPEIRVTLDTEQDYVLLCALYDYLDDPSKVPFSAKQIIDLMKKKPWLALMNQRVVQKLSAATFDKEVERAIEVLELDGLDKVSQLLRNYQTSGQTAETAPPPAR